MGQGAVADARPFTKSQRSALPYSIESDTEPCARTDRDSPATTSRRGLRAERLFRAPAATSGSLKLRHRDLRRAREGDVRPWRRGEDRRRTGLLGLRLLEELAARGDVPEQVAHLDVVPGGPASGLGWDSAFTSMGVPSGTRLGRSRG